MKCTWNYDSTIQSLLFLTIFGQNISLALDVNNSLIFCSEYGTIEWEQFGSEIVTGRKQCIPTDHVLRISHHYLLTIKLH